jgi:predicted dehydrogenase
VERGAAAGKPVLCEKPMAASLAEAEAMAEAVRAAGIRYGTAFDQRHHPAHAAIRAARRGGRGRHRHRIRIAYACWVDAGWASDNWRADAARAGGGALMDLAPHGLDLVDYLLGEPVEEIAALTQRRVQGYAVDDGAMLLGRTGSGVLVQLHVAYNCPRPCRGRQLEVLGTAGQILAERTMGQAPGGGSGASTGGSACARRCRWRRPAPRPSRDRWPPSRVGCAARGRATPSRSRATSIPCA